MSNLMTFRELAQYLGRSESALRAMSDRFAHCKKGSFYSKPLIDRWMETPSNVPAFERDQAGKEAERILAEMGI